MNINNNLQQYQKLMDKYRAENNLSFRRFTDEINHHLPDAFGFKVAHWYAIYRMRYAPDYYSAWYLSQTADGWVKDFAAELVGVME